VITEASCGGHNAELTVRLPRGPITLPPARLLLSKDLSTRRSRRTRKIGLSIEREGKDGDFLTPPRRGAGSPKGNRTSAPREKPPAPVRGRWGWAGIPAVFFFFCSFNHTQCPLLWFYHLQTCL
jgi:hypothetical protein